MERKFDTVITAKKKFGLNLKEVMRYKELIWLFVKRDFKTKYKQTILGPLWYLLQPLFTTTVFTLIFGTLARSVTDTEIPAFLFYMAGNVPWLFFSACVNNTSGTFLRNAHLFGKVYFPRLAIPFSTVTICIINFAIEFALFAVFLVIYALSGTAIRLTWAAALLPLLVLQLALLGMGIGIIVASLTVKYRDLQVLVGFGVSALMYFTPVIYSASSLIGGFYTAVMLNPVSPIIEIIRYGYLGSGGIPWSYWGISLAVTAVVFLLGVALFNRAERTFIDVI